MRTHEFRNKSVLCIGEALWDILPSGEVPGGAPMNVAIHLNQLGVKAPFVSCVGCDEYGNRLLAFLSQQGLDPSFIQKSNEYRTGLVTVILDECKNASYTICEPAAWDSIRNSEALEAMAEESEILVFGSLCTRHEISRNTILRLLDIIPMSLLDINLRAPYHTREMVEPLLHKATMLKMNDEELDVVAQWHKKSFENTKDAMVWMSEFYSLKLICTTLGQEGALLRVGDTLYQHPGYKAEVVDTVGAGDAFLAAFIAACIQGKSWQDALDMACKTGAFLVTQKGATPVLSDALKSELFKPQEME